jgi:hypothetical protein
MLVIGSMAATPQAKAHGPTRKQNVKFRYAVWFSREKAGLRMAGEELPAVPCLEINASMAYIAGAISI